MKPPHLQVWRTIRTAERSVATLRFQRDFANKFCAVCEDPIFRPRSSQKQELHHGQNRPLSRRGLLRPSVPACQMLANISPLMHSSSAGKAGIGRGVGAGANGQAKASRRARGNSALLTSHPTSTSAPTSLLIAPLARRHPSDDRARGDSGGGAPAAAPRWRRRPLVPRDAASPVLWCTFPRPALVSRGDGGSTSEHYHVEGVNSV